MQLASEEDIFARTFIGKLRSVVFQSAVPVSFKAGRMILHMSAKIALIEKSSKNDAVDLNHGTMKAIAYENEEI